MPQLIAEQVLIVLHIGLEPQRPKRPSALGEKVRNPPSDQDSNEVVVKRPPRLVAGRPRTLDDADLVVDHDSRHRERPTGSVARDDDRQFLPCEGRRPTIRFALGPRGASTAALELQEVIEGARIVFGGLAVDPGRRGTSEVGPQRLATAPAQVIRMLVREEQYASAELVRGENSEPTAV